jgi:large subunit ribosomal protein L6
MSRKGNLPIALPKGVEVKVSGSKVSVKGPKGTLQQELREGLVARVEGNELIVSVADAYQDQDMGRYHGLSRTLLQNMVDGVTKGYEKILEMVGVGYRAAVQGRLLDLQIGFSHPTKLPIPEGIQVTVEKGTQIIIKGINKQEVGQFAASTRAKRKPEVYQGKGIRYAGEYVRKKAGKAAAAKTK